MCIIFAERVGVLLFERDGHTGAPGTASVASVCAIRSVRSCGCVGNLRIRMLLGGAEKISPAFSVIVTIGLRPVRKCGLSWVGSPGGGLGVEG